MAEQRLKHVVYEIDSVLYLYDGELPVVAGVVTVPDGNDVWAGAAWVNGYQLDADTGEPLTWTQVTERALASAPAAKSGKKKDADEGADAGRQPAVEDGVRTSEQPRAEELPLEGDGSGVGAGAADGVEGSDD